LAVKEKNGHIQRHIAETLGIPGCPNCLRNNWAIVVKSTIEEPSGSTDNDSGRPNMLHARVDGEEDATGRKVLRSKIALIKLQKTSEV
jgi:hypothetical protein